ncbi:helix-turn-helix domain-containing protein [Senegalia massiliensis]|nr:helix-turn-helix transcriptional regulator [Senegalia massiliensis]
MLRGYQLKRMRILKGLIQDDIAKELDVKRNYISMLENEQREIPEDKYNKWIKFLNSKEARAIVKRRSNKKSNK